MLIVALHQNRILEYQILPKNTNVDHNIYLHFLTNKLLPAVKQKKIRSPLILHDNARPHKHRDIESFFNRHRWTTLKHPPYSPDLNPCDYDLFARIKRPHKGIRYATESQMKAAYENTIYEIDRNRECIGISRLPERWEAVTQNCGEYIT
jgi:transposase